MKEDQVKWSSADGEKVPLTLSITTEARSVPPRRGPLPKRGKKGTSQQLLEHLNHH